MLAQLLYQHFTQDAGNLIHRHDMFNSCTPGMIQTLGAQHNARSCNAVQSSEYQRQLAVLSGT